jgi:hypothetical protein
MNFPDRAASHLFPKRKTKDAFVFPFSHREFSTLCGKHRGKPKKA